MPEKTLNGVVYPITSCEDVRAAQGTSEWMIQMKQLEAYQKAVRDAEKNRLKIDGGHLDLEQSDEELRSQRKANRDTFDPRVPRNRNLVISTTGTIERPKR